MSNVLRFPDLPDRSPKKTKGPQVEDGHTRIANELYEQIMAAPLTLREMRVVLAVIRLTYGWNRKQTRVTGGLLAKLTGLHDSRAAKVLAGLIEKRVIIRHGGSRSPVSVNKHADQWLFETEKHAPPSAKTEWAESAQNGPSQSAQNEPPSKDRKDINTSPIGEESTAGADDAQTLSVENTPPEPSPTPTPDEPKANTLPNCPHKAILAKWTELMPEKRQPLRSLWTQGSAGSRALAARWKQGFSIINDQTGEALYTDEASGIEWWGRFFKFLRRSEFLMRDDSRFFGLDWIVKAENFRKIMEFKYHPELTGGGA